MLFIKFGFAEQIADHDAHIRLVQELFPRTIVMGDGLTMNILEDEELLMAHGLEKP